MRVHTRARYGRREKQRGWKRKMARTYTEFIKSKEIESINAGISFDESELNKNLMPFQRDIVA